MTEPQQFTPTTEEIREAYALSDDGLDFKSAAERRGHDFDRWLAAHDAEVRASVPAPIPADLAADFVAAVGDGSRPVAVQPALLYAREVAKLLSQPSVPVPTREQITDVIARHVNGYFANDWPPYRLVAVMCAAGDAVFALLSQPKEDDRG
jgi:hypothetical protein